MKRELAKLRLFSELPDSQLEALSRIAEVLEVSRGRVLFSQGDVAEHLWGVLEGRVKLSKLSFNGKEQILLVAEAGDTFAEIATLKGQRYPVYATAMEDSRLVRIKGKDLLDLIKKEPQVAVGLIVVLLERVKHLTNMIEDLSLREVPARLSSYILKKSEGKQFLMLDIPKVELAKILGTTPETLSRSFKRLSSMGAIEVRGSLIRVLSPQTLQELAEGFDLS